MKQYIIKWLSVIFVMLIVPNMAYAAHGMCQDGYSENDSGMCIKNCKDPYYRAFEGTCIEQCKGGEEWADPANVFWCYKARPVPYDRQYAGAKQCPAGQEKSGIFGLCFQQCNPGEEGDVDTCYGWENGADRCGPAWFGSTCTRDMKWETRSVPFLWWTIDIPVIVDWGWVHWRPRRYRGSGSSPSVCPSGSEPGIFPFFDGACYESCKSGYFANAFNKCWASCPDGYRANLDTCVRDKDKYRDGATPIEPGVTWIE